STTRGPNAGSGAPRPRSSGSRRPSASSRVRCDARSTTRTSPPCASSRRSRASSRATATTAEAVGGEGAPASGLDLDRRVLDRELAAAEVEHLELLALADLLRIEVLVQVREEIRADPVLLRDPLRDLARADDVRDEPELLHAGQALGAEEEAAAVGLERVRE